MIDKTAIEKAKDALEAVNRIVDILCLLDTQGVEEGSIADKIKQAIAAIDAEKPVEDAGEWAELTKKEMWETIQEIRTLVNSDGTKSIISDIEDYAESYHAKQCQICQRNELPDFARFENRSSGTTDVDK
jgi:hypothetical protein